MRKNITWQLGIIIIFAIFISMIITSISNYRVSYKKTYEAAGIEAVGCANITTGLINPSEINAIVNGDKEILKKVQETINWTTDHKHIFETQYILSLDGTVLAADENLENQGFKAGDPFYMDHNALKTIQETKEPHYSEIYDFGGMKRISGYAPIFKDHDPSKEIIAINVIDFNAKIVNERTLDSVKESFLLGLLPMMLASLLTIWLIRIKTRPISALIAYSKKIAGGDLAIENIQIRNQDEIGELASSLNIMKSSLHELIHHVNSSSVQVAASSEELQAISEQAKEATVQISSAIQEVATGTETQVVSSEESAKAMEEVSFGVQRVAEFSSTAKDSVIEATTLSKEGSQSIQKAILQMDLIEQGTQNTTEAIGKLNDRSYEIEKIIDVITNLADQTNLLSLNAAIEAARAGEHGKGFAVVADEVRKLADQSRSSADQVVTLIQEIQKDTSTANQEMDKNIKEVNVGKNVIQETGEVFEQVLLAIENVNRQVDVLSSTSDHISVNAEEVAASVEQLVLAAKDVSVESSTVAASSEEQLASVEEIVRSSEGLSKLAQELQEIVGKFKI